MEIGTGDIFKYGHFIPAEREEAPTYVMKCIDGRIYPDWMNAMARYAMMPWGTRFAGTNDETKIIIISALTVTFRTQRALPYILDWDYVTVPYRQVYDCELRAIDKVRIYPLVLTDSVDKAVVNILARKQRTLKMIYGVDNPLPELIGFTRDGVFEYETENVILKISPLWVKRCDLSVWYFCHPVTGYVSPVVEPGFEYRTGGQNLSYISMKAAFSDDTVFPPLNFLLDKERKKGKDAGEDIGIDLSCIGDPRLLNRSRHHWGVWSSVEHSGKNFFGYI